MHLTESIQHLKTTHKAVILAHNYQRPEVRAVADVTGDSLELSIKAAHTEAEIILFCGVRFMAETAKILSPEKTVLLPEPDAGCPMADMITADQLVALKNSNPEAAVLCYINTSAEVKAHADICCTSSNAAHIVETQLSDTARILFVPDKYLAMNTARATGREFMIWQGYCPTHARILPEYVRNARTRHPNAQVMVHPECSPAVCELADAVLSTGQMYSWARDRDADEFIVGTEKEMCSRLAELLPRKRFYPVTDIAVCPNMKKTGLSSIYNELTHMNHPIEISHSVIDRARASIERMIAASS